MIFVLLYMEKVKIAIIGTHGVGKTTECLKLCYLLKIAGKDAKFIGEISRICPLPINENTTKDAEKWILYTQIAKELSELPKYDFVISDRGAIDNYCYYLNKFGKEEYLDLLVNEHSKTYDFIFKIPIGFVPEGLIEDGIRALDPVFQKDIDKLISSELKERNIPFYEYEGAEKALQIILGK